MAPMMMNPTFHPRGTRPPVSNAERQREFRRRNPDYYKRYRQKQKAAMEVLAAQRAAVTQPLALPAPAPGIPEGVWITLPALVPVEAAKPEAPMPAPRMMRLDEGG